MKTLLLFEFKKLFKQKTIWLLVGLTLLAVICLYGFQATMKTTVRTQILDQYKWVLDMSEETQENYKRELEQAIAADDQELIEELKESIGIYQNNYNVMLKRRQAYESELYDYILENQLDTLAWVADPHTHGIYGIADNQLVSDFTLRATYAETEYLLENNIEPFVQNTMSETLLPTIYDNFTGSAAEEWAEMTSRYSTKATYFLYQLIQNLYIPAIILIGCFLFGNTLSSEMQKKTRKIRFHQVLPFKQEHLFIAKFLTGYLALFVYILIMVGFPLVIATLFDQFGSLDYPVLVYDGYTTDEMWNNETLDTFHFITLKVYLFKALLLALPLSLLIYNVYFFFTRWSKEPILTMLLTSLACYLAMMIPTAYNPFQYLMVDQVITQELQLQMWDTSFKYSTGILVTTLMAFLLVGANYVFHQAKFNQGRKVKEQ